MRLPYKPSPRPPLPKERESKPARLLSSLRRHAARESLINKIMKQLNSMMVMIVALVSAQVTFSQKVFRVSEADAIGPAEVSIAINPKNPDNLVGASFALGRPPRPRYGSYNYSSMDGGRTWKTIPVADPKNLTQGADVVYFGADGIAYHIHLSFDGIRVARPKRAES